LTVLRNDESAGFSRVATGDEFWFPYRYQSTQLFFTGTKLLVLDVLPREEKFNQNHFLAVIAAELSKENSDAKRRIDKKQLVVHMDKSMRHNRRKIQ
jgi:hypothetical protein